ncbi:MAG: hypothetical protein CFE24_04390 [Flavobacterium sp. BFFFF2]|nr:MAG: hypothetical protein CFE24_04390 [Flavobacterium sp. BFFFF2]
MIHDFVHFLCWPKENEPKERAFLARINVIFAFGKTSLSSLFYCFLMVSLNHLFFNCVCFANSALVVMLQAEISSKDSEILPA